MRAKSFYYSILLMFCLGGLASLPVFAGVNDFYFSDFTGDYYLTRDEQGQSFLRVEESVTAVFPDFNQNKGICRQIPFTNQDGKNITLPSLTDLELTRNGKIEPIYSISKEDNYFNVCTGTEEYVKGKQTYVFGYEFSRVITDFKKHQELYWDTNGNGAMQRFESVTARVHLEEDILDSLTGEAWCYIGKYGEGDQKRCEVTKVEDGFMFEAKDIASFEGLTFDIEFKPDTFVVLEPEKDYSFVRYLVFVGSICLGFVGFFVWEYLKFRDREQYYKGIFIKPEYQPNKDYSLVEMAEIYLGQKKDMKVAMLLEMIVEREIELKKEEGEKWSILVKKPVEGEYANLLEILNGGLKAKVGSEVELKHRVATNSLVTIKNVMEQKILGKLKKDGLVESKYRMGYRGRSMLSTILIGFMIACSSVGLIMAVLDEPVVYGYDFVLKEQFLVIAFGVVMVSALICMCLNNKIRRYSSLTLKGLKASRYMDGLKLYIEMAEKERLRMLQSVDGADVSPEGIVKIYEKLLPYAAVFGLEESWMNEMKKYCEIQEVEEPDYLLAGATTSAMTHGLHSAAGFATSATILSNSVGMSSSGGGGGSSSGFSGGGGGGFSGGGGGGGGFSGR